MSVINANYKKTELCVVSYNSRGFGPLKQEYCRQLISSSVVGDKIPILCNQENFMLRNNTYKINQALSNSYILIKPGVKESHSSGRPKGGLFIAVPGYFRNNIQDVSPNFWRIQAVLIKTHGSTILLINSYFPVDTRGGRIDEVELNEIFENIRIIIAENSFSSFILCGDINCDFLRKTDHVKTVQNFLDEFSLIVSWNLFEIDFTHCQELQDSSYFSTVDHFFMSHDLAQHVCDAGVLHSVDNSSDHDPIYCTIKVEPVEESRAKVNTGSRKPCWSKASPEEKQSFKVTLDDFLSHVEVPESLTSCKDVHCSKKEHQNDIEKHIIEVLGSIEVKAFENLPVSSSSSSRKRKPKPGWSDLVKPYRDTALFWNQVWKSAGRPINTVLHNVMKRSRNVYHYHFKKCHKSEKAIRNNKLLDACVNGDGDLFEQIKLLRKSSPAIPASMDGEQGERIPQHFQNIYSRLYNSNEDGDEVREVEADVKGKVNQSHLKDVDKVTPELVKEAVRHLKGNKSDPVYAFSSDCLKNAPDILYRHLSVAIQSLLIHGHVPVFLLLATLVPIIKDKLGSISSSKNYRSIALSSQVLKLLDWIILLLFGESLGVDELQFAYQESASTTMCTWTAVETIDYFMRNGSEVFTCMMDMTKAFDLVRHSLMFKKVIKTGLSIIFVRLIIFIYVNQMANVRWVGEFSNLFTMKNGVRQGAILSAIFYCIYMNDLFKILRRSKLGCWINGDFLGILGYSDDNLILAPSLHALQEMVLICEKYAREHNLKFSTDPDPKKCKTKCIAFLRRPRDIPCIKLCGNSLPWVSTGKHLGNTLENKIDGMKQDTRVKRAQYITRNNNLYQEFSFCHPHTRFHLNSVYNTSFTGSSLWNLFSKETDMLLNSWNTSFRIMFDLPLSTHRYFVEPVSGKVHLMNMLMKRFLAFLNQIENSKKSIPKKILRYVKNDARSNTGANLRRIMLLVNKVKVCDVTKKDIDEVKYAEVPPEDEWKVGMVREIIDIKYSRLDVENFNEEELNEILDYLCTS